MVIRRRMALHGNGLVSVDVWVENSGAQMDDKV